MYATEKGDGDEEFGRMHGGSIGERLVAFVLINRVVLRLKS